MAITTVGGIRSGIQSPVVVAKWGGTMVTGNNLYSPFYNGFYPGPASAPSVGGIGGQALTSYTGQIGFTTPSSGNAYLAGLRFNSTHNCTTQPFTVFFCDRLWHNSSMSVTSTSGQTINSVAWPARDMDGSTNGRGVLIGVEVSATMGSGTPTWTMAYTNSAGAGGRSVVTGNQTANLPAGAFVPVELSGGDVGVRSIQTWTNSASHVSGTMHLVAYRVLAQTTIMSKNTQPCMRTHLDAVRMGFPRMYDNSVPFLLLRVPSTTANGFGGFVQYAIG